MRDSLREEQSASQGTRGVAALRTACEAAADASGGEAADRLAMLKDTIAHLRSELDHEREERNYFQLERDKINTFWEISKRASSVKPVP